MNRRTFITTTSAAAIGFGASSFVTGAQPHRGAGSPFPLIDPKYPDLPVQKWYEYGFKEGVPRLLDLWDQAGVKVTSHMVGQAVERHPELAKEIVERGHEASGMARP